jgi:hypothetical protein
MRVSEDVILIKINHYVHEGKSKSICRILCMSVISRFRDISVQHSVYLNCWIAI